MDRLIKKRTRIGMRVGRCQAEIITPDMENILQNRGLVGDHNPETLPNTLLYVFDLYFALCGRDEHRRFRHCPSQITLKTTSDGRRYIWTL